MKILQPHEPLAIALVDAIRSGNHSALRDILNGHPGLAEAHIGDASLGGVTRSLLHVATDWPGHFPECGAAIRLLVAAGADVNARCAGAHRETPLHWAASSNDLEALDALLEAGADLDASGAVIADGTPLTDAVAFAQWDAARWLVARGAAMRFAEAAALGVFARIEEQLQASPPNPSDLNAAFWYACHGGQIEVAELLLEKGASINWLPPWEHLTPLDAADRNGFGAMVEWLRERGGESAAA